MTIRDFPEWLQDQLDQLGWTRAELARRSGISPSQITRIMNREQGPGNESLEAIATALKMPHETVFRAAGLLPPVPPEQERKALWDKLFLEADSQTQEDAIAFLEHRRQQQSRLVREPKTQPR